MKNVLILFAAFLLITSCAKQSTSEEPSGKWNGYAKYLKTGEMVHTLWAGKNINVGTVTYGLDDNANFYVTYDCSASGWKISETHMFAGDKINMPLNRPGAPKIGLFPNSGYHNPRVSTFTYRVPLVQLPPCASPGFVVASHCIVRSPAGRTETAWAEGDYTFSDKGWGWYDAYYYDPPQDPPPVLYGTAYTNDTLRLYHIDVVNGGAELILTEYVGNSPGSYDGAAYAVESGMFFFTNHNTQELWVNQLTSEDPSFCAGTLNGLSASGAYYDGAYFYVNENLNTINEVFFTNNWTVSSETLLDTIPGLVTVNDIAMSPEGDVLLIMGQYNGGNTELISWDVSDHSFCTLSILINDGAQIAFGSDGLLYAIAPIIDGGSNSYSYIVELDSGVVTELNIGSVIILDDPFTDISGGPHL